MKEHLLKAGASMVPSERDALSRLPYMRSWFRTRSAIVLHLTNGTLQVGKMIVFNECFVGLYLVVMSPLSSVNCVYIYLVLQINFFQDHTKLILCPLMGAVTYIDGKRDSKTFRMNLIERYGCCKELFSRLRYARTMVERLISMESKHTPKK